MPEIRQRDPNDLIKTKDKEKNWGSIGPRIDDAVREKTREHRDKKEEANEYAAGVTEEAATDMAIKVRDIPGNIKHTVQQLQPKTKERVLNEPEPEDPPDTVEWQKQQLAGQKAQEEADSQEDSQCSTDSDSSEPQETETPSCSEYEFQAETSHHYDAASSTESPPQNSSRLDIKEKPKGDIAPKQRQQQEPKTRSHTEQTFHKTQPPSETDPERSTIRSPKDR